MAEMPSALFILQENIDQTNLFRNNLKYEKFR